MSKRSRSEDARRELHGTVEYLQAFERRHSEYCAGVDDRLREVRDSVSDGVCAQLSKLLLSTESMLSAAIDKMGSANVSDEIAASVRSWLENHLQATKDLSSSQQQHLLDELRNVPLLTKGAISDALRQLEQQSQMLSLTLTSAQQQLSNLHSDVRDNVSAVGGLQATISQRMDALDGHLAIRNTTGGRGKVGERALFDLLSERLMGRDGYTLEMVCGTAHSCDIAIKREGYPTVRIESKAHGRDSGEKVRARDVDKFRRDLLELNEHGIMVSLHSGIVGIGNLEIQQLENGKFAVYLSNNNYDTDMVVDMVHLLYKLDSVTNSSDSSVMLSSEILLRVRDRVQALSSKLDLAKRRMRETLTLLSEIELESLSALLLGSDAAPTLPTCSRCGKTFKSRAGLTGHARHCKVAESGES